MPGVLIPPMVFVTTVLFVWALVPPKPRRLSGRLAPYAPKAGLMGRERELAQSFVGRVIVPVVSLPFRVLAALAPANVREQAQHDLERAGEPISLSAFLGLRAALMLGLPALYVLYVLGGQVPLQPLTLAAPLLLFWMGQRLPRMWLRGKVEERERRMERGLAGAMDLITISMEAGLAFDASLSQVVAKTTGPLSEEFERVLQEITVGKSRREALRDMGRRVALPDMTSFVSAVVQAETTGLALGQVMRGLSDELRTRRRQRAEEQAMKAPIKMLFPLIVFIFPSMMLVVVGPGLVIIFSLLGSL